MKTALITGGNRGIGFEVARQLGKQGLRVWLGARDDESGNEAVESLRSEGAEVELLELDVADTRSIVAALDLLARQKATIDVLVNNAGVYRSGTTLTTRSTHFRESFEVHFFGPLTLCQMLVPGMLERGYGRVVNVSSGYGSFDDGLEGAASYSVSKASLNALTLKLANELPDYIKVNAVCPGWVRTRMGGSNADRSSAEGASGVVWAATLPDDGPTGGFFRDQERIPW